MRWLLHALDHAGRGEEAIEILQRETAHTPCYVNLVERLLKSGRRDEVRQWARRGIEATRAGLPGIARELERILRKLAAAEDNRPMVAAYRAEEFFRCPGVHAFQDLQKAATEAGVWETVRAAALRFLETGRRPGARAPVPGQKSPGRTLNHPGAQVAGGAGRPGRAAEEDSGIGWKDCGCAKCKGMDGPRPRGLFTARGPPPRGSHAYNRPGSADGLEVHADAGSGVADELVGDLCLCVQHHGLAACGSSSNRSFSAGVGLTSWRGVPFALSNAKAGSSNALRHSSGELRLSPIFSARLNHAIRFIR